MSEYILRYKKDIEEAYGRILAPYAAKQPCSGSRRRAEKEREDENRASFQRDRDRIIHSEAFRRMMYKTQVFVNHEGDRFRTRLTHSLEVAQLSRGIAKSLALNEDLTEAIALGHDLGHTPFGHAAEAVLDEKMKAEGLGGFYHNEQSVRVVEELETRYGAEETSEKNCGLNLTYEVREGMLKHNNDRTGMFGELKPNALCSTAEGQIVKLTDTLAYTCHDLDDGIKSGILEKNCNENPDIYAAFEDIKAMIADAAEFEISYGQYDRLGFIGQLIHYFIDRLTLSGYENLKANSVHTREDIANLAEKGIPVIAFDNETAGFFKALKKFVGKGIYTTSTVQMMDEKAKRVIGGMYDAFFENILLLPPKWRYRAANREKFDLYKSEPNECAARSRIICDYISCMTDRYALEEYERLFNPNVRI